MKLLTLCAFALFLTAAPAFAIQVGQLPPPQKVDDDPPAREVPRGHHAPSELPAGETGDKPTRPVPEPGTIALAAMSAAAIGAAVRKRRSR